MKIADILKSHYECDGQYTLSGLYPESDAGGTDADGSQGEEEIRGEELLI